MASPPRISGTPLRTLARVARTGAGVIPIYRALRGDLQVDELARLPDGVRGGYLRSLTPVAGRPPRDLPSAGLPVGHHGWAPSSESFARAYAEGKTKPSAVAERCFAAAEGRAVILARSATALDEARASDERHAKHATLGPLDGVPVLVKEQCFVRGLPCQAGSTFVTDAPREEDATPVARLRAQGAIILGTTPMTELGMSPLGQNRLRNMPRNVHAPAHLAGGSSTGSGVAVGLGVVPIAVGVDGGGSIRIPAAWSGVFGIKPSWGRISGYCSFAEGSVSHVGPIASSTLDLARSFAVMSGRDERDPETWPQPPTPPSAYEAALARGVKGLRIGVEEREWADAADPIARAGRAALRALEREGAILVPIRLELTRFAVAIGTLTIGPESYGLYRRDFARYADSMGHELQITFSAVARVPSSDFLDAERLRVGLRTELAHAFRDIDLIAMPTTADLPPAVTDAEMASGFLDSTALRKACRYAFQANLSGLPSGTAPVGFEPRGDQNLPIGLQLMGDAWDEATIFAALAHLERIGAAEVRRPPSAVGILP